MSDSRNKNDKKSQPPTRIGKSKETLEDISAQGIPTYTYLPTYPPITTLCLMGGDHIGIS